MWFLRLLRRRFPVGKHLWAGILCLRRRVLRRGKAILERLARCDERTLVFFLISGGGSSLVEQPLGPGVTLADFQQLHSALITCGAPIEEINVVRKHLSATKGGRLAAAAARSMKITFAISDVPDGRGIRVGFGAYCGGPVYGGRCRAHRAEIWVACEIAGFVARNDRAA